MRDNIYISTAAFAARSLRRILDFCSEYAFTNIELGSNINYSADNLELVFKAKSEGMKFLLHNYFPPPAEDDFVLNLASDNKEILLRSIAHCKEAIDLSAELAAPFYSVHAGFAFHAAPSDLGRPQAGLVRIPLKKAYRIFVDSIIELSEYADGKNIKLAIENNVVADFNVASGKNEIFLLSDAEEFLKCYKDVASDNLFSLIDLGHLKVSSTVLRFDRDQYLERIAPYAIGFHLNDNRGFRDEHFGLAPDVWFKDYLRSHSDKVFIIEAQNLACQKLKENYQILEKICQKQS